MANDAQPDKPTSQPAEPQPNPQVNPAQIPEVDPSLLTEHTRTLPDAPNKRVVRITKK